MWIPRLASVALMTASAAVGYKLVMLIVDGSLPTNWWVAGAAIAVIFLALFALMGVSGFLLSFIVESDGEGHFTFKKGDFVDFLYPRFKRKYAKTYCGASMHVLTVVLNVSASIVMFGMLSVLAYQHVSEHPTVALYVVGGFIALVAVIVLCAASKASRTALFCFLGGSAVLGTAWFIHSLDWASAGKWTAAAGATALPWVGLVVGLVALFFVLRFFTRTKAYRAMCPMNSDR